MELADGIRAHDEEAHLYDRQAQAYEWYGHDACFGMCFEYVKSGESLLDLGIGTGLASIPFAKAGLEIYGVDGSSEMLRVCESKGFAKELKCLDLLDTPLPYPDAFFSHVLSLGVFHFIGDLEPIVGDVSRMIRRGGIFAFTLAKPGVKGGRIGPDPGEGYEKMDTEWGVAIITHGDAYVLGLLEGHGFEILKKQRFLMRGGEGHEEDMVFAICVARKREVESSPR